jgi:ubiquinone/menaquinone biosynthesis C-methylase UbiE
MDRSKVDYDQIARNYHTRFNGSKLEGIDSALVELAVRGSAKSILEAGCGTGYWIESLRAKTVAKVFGLDASIGMLGQAARRLGHEGLVLAVANRMPFRERSFDLVFCVNALHHFDDPADFLTLAARLLVPGGVFAVIGIDPRTVHRYHYEYFEGALELDLKRYPSYGQIIDGLGRAGFANVELRIVDPYDTYFTGKEIYQDPFLEKQSNSLLALLSDDTYAKGMQTIENAIAANPLVKFRSKVDFGMITGRAPLSSP